MTARELFQAGRLNESVQALGAELRKDPTDTRRRTFLFELLCFAGEYERAEKQLDILASEKKESDLGALLYRAAIHAERTRNEMFSKRDFPSGRASERVDGTFEGRPFSTIEDGDPRIGPRLEVFAAGAYLWIPFEHLASIEIPEPKRLRDLIWTPALVRTGPAFKGKELGEVLLPVLTPLSSRHPDDHVRLGRSTVWEETEDGRVVPAGQKMIVVDGEEVPILEIRSIHFVATQAAA
ncbi:MAG: virulence protein SciE type [Bryobacterales bacterium]|nr:virulence protein SciE type [Bryobacterales bacterium]MEB2360133.1 type VI secretion system accessory protein TagJ [Bryobacterales bacterium]